MTGGDRASVAKGGDDKAVSEETVVSAVDLELDGPRLVATGAPSAS